MTFLELCKAVRSEAGLSGDGPYSVVNQSGMYGKIVGWVQESYAELLKMDRWSFLWNRATVALTTATLTQPTNMGRVVSSQVWNLSQTPRGRVEFLPFATFDALDDSITGVPRYFTRRPDGELLFHPTPASSQNIRIDYYEDGATLTANADVPVIPDAQLHKIIAYMALAKYAMHDENMTAKQSADLNFSRLHSLLYDKYGQKIQTSPASLTDVFYQGASELV